jgi:hypothetical protein
MAIYSCNISNVSRAKGANACATLAYITGERVINERLNKSYKYAHADRVAHFETLLPEGAPEAFENPAVLVNAIENYEKAENARTAKKIIVALPHELELEQQKEVLRDFCVENFTSKGYPCVIAIHRDKDDQNIHAHILVPNRQINSKGKFATKCQKRYVLDENGDRVPLIDETGKQKVDSRNRLQWKRENVKVNPLDLKETLLEIRQSWETICNEKLPKHAQISSKSHVDRGLKTIPTIHEGYRARALERSGRVSERCETNRQIRAWNERLIASMRRIADQVRHLECVQKLSEARRKRLRVRFDETPTLTRKTEKPPLREAQKPAEGKRKRLAPAELARRATEQARKTNSVPPSPSFARKTKRGSR